MKARVVLEPPANADATKASRVEQYRADLKALVEGAKGWSRLDELACGSLISFRTLIARFLSSSFHCGCAGPAAAPIPCVFAIVYDMYDGTLALS